ncbi:MAG: hypothetical protein HeimC2_43720 [Candidatus Heimdallarchaeota archaeon LC_2]|nr:MAG: hypothetical protein HeimC2_43720 [Candidatus Heimdallarchaeota archaeon LC_2]
MLSRKLSTLDNEEIIKLSPKVSFSGVSKMLEPWMNLARERIFSLAAGGKVAKIAPKIMEVGFAKVLYAADHLGMDIQQSNPYVLFAPDGTVTYNPIRIKRGFTYGAILNLEFDGMMATNNSLPNGCGFSIYEIEDPIPDVDLLEYLTSSQQRIGNDQLSQLGKGNHFAGVYNVIDPESGEDTHRRFVVVHCSGHVGGKLLSNPEEWLSDVEGFHNIETPHGDIVFLEGEARNRYYNQFLLTESANAENRDITMGEIFDKHPWKKLEEITHQGLIEKGASHIIGTQKHEGLMPIAFNPEEGLVAVKHKPNLTSEFLDKWTEGGRVRNLNLENKFSKLNITPHGGGYEFIQPLDSLEINLDKNGINYFELKFRNSSENHKFTYFREIRNYMTFRRRQPIMNMVHQANMAEIVYELPGLMQIYPLKSIPGGSH